MDGLAGLEPPGNDALLNLNVPCAGGAPTYLEMTSCRTAFYRATAGTLLQHQEICRTRDLVGAGAARQRYGRASSVSRRGESFPGYADALLSLPTRSVADVNGTVLLRGLHYIRKEHFFADDASEQGPTAEPIGVAEGDPSADPDDPDLAATALRLPDGAPQERADFLQSQR